RPGDAGYAARAVAGARDVSLRALDAVFRSTLPATDKVALLALADWADDDGGRIFPSMRTAAAKASLGERTMQRVVKRYVTSGVLELVTPATPRMPAEYRLHFDRLPGVSATTSGVSVETSGVSQRHPRGVSDD